MLVGGCEGFLREMSNDNVTPDIKTITQLLHVIPSNLDSEKVKKKILFPPWNGSPNLASYRRKY
jgi:hypothetical protein